MKRLRNLLLMLLATVTLPLMAGDLELTWPEDDPCSKYGADESMAKQEYSLYREFYKQDNFDDARNHWRYIFLNAPGLSKNTYTNGVKMYKAWADAEEDSAAQQALVDTVIAIYKKRIECYGDEAKTLGDIFYTAYKYRKDEVEYLLGLGKEAIHAAGDDTKYYLLFPYFQYNVISWKRGNLEDDALLEEFDFLMGIIDNNIAGLDPADEKGNNAWKGTAQKVESYLPAEILSCSKLVERFEGKRDEYMGDLSTLKKYYNNIKLARDTSMGMRCTRTVTFEDIVLKIAEMEPSPVILTEAAGILFRRGETDLALDYFNQAFEMEEDIEDKADIAFNIAKILSNEKKYNDSRKWCRKALEIKPNWGAPYILIGDMYASSGSICGGTDGELAALAAVDKYYKAKSVDPEAASDAQSKINRYSAYFPSVTYLFERGWNEGDSYTYSCWIGETTTLRAKK